MPEVFLRQEIVLEQRLPVPVDRAIQAWSDPRKLERWAWGSLGLDARAEADFRIGGTLSVSTARPDGARWSLSGEYTAIEPGRRIAHTLRWDAPMGYADANETVEAAFFPDVGETVIRFRHEGNFSEAARNEHERGWRDVLEHLRQFLSEGCLAAAQPT